MLSEEFVGFVRTQPFRPYRIRLSDGRYHEIEHPDMAVVVGLDSILIGVRRHAGLPEGATDEVLVSLSQVVEIEFTDAG